MDPRIENLNYYSDARVRAKPADVPEVDGEPLPTRWQVCGLCDGDGKVVNPSIDCGGLSAEDFHDDPDFASDYFSGVYDVTCPTCAGRTTVPVVDVSQCTFAQKRALVEQMRQERADAEVDAEWLSELRMGA